MACESFLDEVEDEFGEQHAVLNQGDGRSTARRDFGQIVVSMRIRDPAPPEDFTQPEKPDTLPE